MSVPAKGRAAANLQENFVVSPRCPRSFWGVDPQRTRARPSASAMDSRHARRLSRSRTADASEDFMCVPSRPKCGGAHPALDCPRYSSVGQKS